MKTSKDNNVRRGAGNAWLLAGVALIVGLDLGHRMGDSGFIGVANAAQEGSAVVNPADQRRQMIAELRKTNERIDHLRSAVEKTLSGGPVDVAVVEFPKNLVVSGN